MVKGPAGASKVMVPCCSISRVTPRARRSASNPASQRAQLRASGVSRAMAASSKPWAVSSSISSASICSSQSSGRTWGHIRVMRSMALCTALPRAIASAEAPGRSMMFRPSTHWA
ncbi:hypothetical protein D3C86_1534070 [compost metagenome]